MSKYNQLFCFGDSWGYGSELDFSKGEVPFANILAKHLKINLVNYSRPNMSLGLILRKLAITAKNINSKDLVLIVVPPDSRWYTEESGVWDTLNYEKDIEFYFKKTNQWFIYHNQLFIYAIGNILNDIGCEYMFMHNYGRFPLEHEDYHFSKSYRHKFLSEDSLTALLTKDSDKHLPIEIEDENNANFHGIYFEGCHWHPNQKGHHFIADLILKKLTHS